MSCSGPRSAAPRVARGCLCLSLLTALLLPAGPAQARSVLLYGGAASARYLYSGEQDSSAFFELASHDLRFRAGGVLWYDRSVSRLQLSTGVFVGGEISVNVSALRMPIGTIQHTEVWRLGPGLDLNVEATLAVQPATLAEGTAARPAAAAPAGSAATSVAAQGVVGRPLLLFDGGAELSYQKRRNLFAIRVGHETLFHFPPEVPPVEEIADPGDPEQIIASAGIQIEGRWTHELSALHQIIVRPVYRAMLADTRTLAPVTGLVGVMAGYGLRLRDRLELTALGGVSAVLNLPRSHLFDIEPLLNVEASYRDRFNIWSASGGWRVRENNFASGLPMRVVDARLSWAQPLTSRRVRGGADLSYERVRFGHFGGGSGQRPADTSQAVRLQGLLTWSVARGWRVFAEAAVAFGHTARSGTCDPGAPCPAYGYSAATLLGVAYISASRLIDERVLDDRVMGLVR